MRQRLLKELQDKGAERSREWAARNADAATDQAPWTLDDWFVALFGECGEAANIVKKMRRGFGNRESADDLRALLARELVDCVIYLEHFAREADEPLPALARAYDAMIGNVVTRDLDLARRVRRLGMNLGHLGRDVDRPAGVHGMVIAEVLAELIGIARAAGVDLDAAIVQSFNKKSAELGFPQRIGEG